jgi:hypothetical protein
MSKPKLHIPATAGFSVPNAADIRSGTFRRLSASIFQWTIDIALTDPDGNPVVTPSGASSVQVVINDAGVPSVAAILSAAETELRNEVGMVDGDPA